MYRYIRILRGLWLAPLLVLVTLPGARASDSLRSGEALPRAALTGVVRSAGDGSPVSGASVTIEGISAVAFSDATGRFRLSDVVAGEHTVVVERIGFETERVAVVVSGDAGTVERLEVELTPEPVLMAGVVVAAAGELERRMETPASISALDGELVERVSPTHPSEVLNRIPGVWVSPTSTEGHFTAIRQPITTSPVYLFLEDGVPTRSPGFFNHNALYEVNVPQADRIEVIRGPGTALYGSDAIGGVIDVGTRPASVRPEVRAVLEGSSNDFYRGLVSLSGTRGDDGVRLDLNVTEGGGWRDAQDYDRRSATLRWDRTMAGGLSLRTTVAYSRVFQNDASAISREDLEANPEVNYHPIVYRSVDALRVASRLERRTDRSLLQISPFFRWNSLDLMPSWMLSYDPVIYRTGHRSLGLMVRYHRELRPLRGRITVGVDVDRSPGFREEDRISVVREGEITTDWQREDRLYDYRATFLGVSPYLQLVLRPIDGVNITGGLRYDDVGFDYRTELDPVHSGPHRRPENATVRYSNLGPSLGAAWAVRPELNLFASFRESFRSPSEGQLFRQGGAESSVELNPVRARSVEGGLRGEAASRLAWEVSLYRMDVRDDILSFIRPEDGRTESVNAGRTRHEGIEVGLFASLPRGLSADLSLTRASHRYLEWSPRAELDYAGNRIELAPRDLATARLASPLPALPGSDAAGRVELEVAHMGEFWLDPENDNAYEGQTLWNLRAQLPVTAGLELSGRVLNLTDRRYAERASFHPSRGEELNPGNPRTLYLGLQYRWEQ